jgi:AraC-like DNA-binding protein
MEWLTPIGIALAGYSAVSAVLLFLAYALLIRLPNKSAYSVASSGALLLSLAVLQVLHLRYFLGGPAPLETLPYRLALYTVPPTFFLFGRWAILPQEPFRAARLLHLLPIPVLLALPASLAMPVLFTIGTAYSIWLANLLYGLRDTRRQFRVEFFLFGTMCVLAVFVLLLGFALPFVGAAAYYHLYSLFIAIAFAIVTAALIAHPDLLGEIADAARAKYGASTLKEVDVDAALRRLEALMATPRVYQDENLGLASLAEQLGLSTHQLSELVNSRLGMGFSRYVRERRVEAAKALLLKSPAQSVLSVGLETGFGSQSSFYSAFREVTGLSPGEFRRVNGRTPASRAPD